jgi:hypothetical protein
MGSAALGAAGRCVAGEWRNAGTKIPPVPVWMILFPPLAACKRAQTKFGACPKKRSGTSQIEHASFRSALSNTFNSLIGDSLILPSSLHRQTPRSSGRAGGPSPSHEELILGN